MPPATTAPAPEVDAVAIRELDCRGFTVRAATLDEQARSVEAVVSTAEVAQVYDWGLDQVIDEVLVPAGARFAGQVPLLENHARYSLDGVLGSTRELRVEGEQVIGRLFFAEGDDYAERAWNKVRQGHVTDVSIGYRVDESVLILPGQTGSVSGQTFTAGARRLRVVTAFTIREVSLVPIGADQRAKIRAALLLPPSPTKGSAMPPDSVVTAPDEQNRTAPVAASPAPAAAPPTAQPVNTDAIRAEAQRTERQRIADITALRSATTPDDVFRRAIDEGLTVDQAAAAILTAERALTRPAAPAAISRDNERDLTRNVLAGGLLHRSGARMVDPRAGEATRRAQEQLAEQSSRFASLSLLDMAREACRIDRCRDPQSGVEPFTRDEVLRAAMSSPTLSNAFTTSVNARLLGAYEEAGDTTDWCEVVDVPDFKTNDAIALGKTGALDKLARGKTANDATFDDSKETYRVHRYAKKMSVDEQDLIDDSLDVFQTVAPQMGMAAQRIRPDMVYYLLIANPTLAADNVAVFHTDHGNATTTVLGAAGLKAAISGMMLQTQNGVNLNVEPRFLIVAPTLQWTAKELLNSTAILIAGDTDTERGNANTLASAGLQLRIDARLENGVTDPNSGAAAVGAATKWFLASNPFRTVRVAYRTGTGRRPVVRSYMLNQGQWGMGWDINLDIGAKILGHRGLFRGNT